MLLYSSHTLSALRFYTHSLLYNFLSPLFVVLNCTSITNNLCFSTHSSLGMILMLPIFAVSFCLTITESTILLTEPAAYVLHEPLHMTRFSPSGSICIPNSAQNHHYYFQHACPFMSAANTTISFLGIQLTNSLLPSVL